MQTVKFNKREMTVCYLEKIHVKHKDTNKLKVQKWGPNGGNQEQEEWIHWYQTI